jgi:4-hydroxybenzoate polyprenyltransferase
MGKILFRLFRLPNIIILAVLQYFVHYYIIKNFYSMEGYTIAITHFDFALLVLSGILIAAAGYVINDVFDIEIDKINKGDKRIVGKEVSIPLAKQLHAVLSIIGVLLALYVGYKVGNVKLGFIYLLIAIALYYYSLKYKRQLITGNFVVSIIAALSIFLVWLYDFFALQSTGSILIIQQNQLLLYLYIYAAFAFTTSFMREIVKDIVDVKGDKEVNCRTIPIKWGQKTAKMFVVAFAFITMLVLGHFQKMLYIADIMYAFYYAIVLQALLAYFIFKTITAKEKKDFQYLSEFAKLIIVAGIFSIQVIYIW